MRLFTGLDLPAEVLDNLSRLLEGLSPAAPINWSPVENLHITTKFIGEWPEGRLEELKAALAGIPPRPPIPMRIHGLGFFPNPRSPRVFWCGIGAPGLESLGGDIDRATSALGIPGETRAFSAHLTLARIKDKPDLDPLRKAIAGLPSLDFGQFDVHSFFLYQSRLHPTGSVYTKLSEFPLSK